MLPILLITLILTYFIYAIHKLDLHRPALEALCKPVGEWFGEAGNPVRAGVWAGALIVSLMAWFSPQTSFLGEMRGEITGMAITVIVIDELAQYRNALQEKQRLIRQMGSHSNDFALEAIRQIREKGWHKNGLLNGKYFFRANLRKADLYQAQLVRGWFFEANLENADLEEANLQGANFEQAVLKQANFQSTNLQCANLIYTDLSGANMKQADLTNARLNAAILKDAFLNHTCFAKASLQLTDFQNTTMWSVNLKSADLRGANLVDADLRGANFSDANLYRANFRNAKYDMHTIWPDGFDPVAAGAIKVED